MVALLLGLACAHAPTPPAPWADALPVQGEPQELLAVAERLQAAGNLAGARATLAGLVARGDAPAETWARYGLALELEERFADADAVYAEVARLAGSAVAGSALNATFRRALVLDELGRYQEALTILRAVDRHQAAWDRADFLTLELALGTALLRVGEVREGLAHLEPALGATAATDEARWLRARALHALSRASLHQAAATSLAVGDRRVDQALAERTRLIVDAEGWLVKVAETAEPEWILAGLLDLGDAYVRLYADLVTAPAPADLDAEGVARWRDSVHVQAAVLLTKAWNAYDRGVTEADAWGTTNRFVAALRSRRDSLPL